MNNLRYAIFAIVATLLPAANSFAAQQVRDIPLDLASATHLAMGLRPELRLEEEKRRIAQSKVREAKGNFLPTLDLSGSSSYIKNYDTFTGIQVSAQIAGQDVTADVEKDVEPYELNGRLALSYNLYGGGRDKALLGKAKGNLQAERYSRDIAAKKLRLEVANAYWGLKKAKLRYLMAKRDFEVAQLKMTVATTKHRLNRLSDAEYEAELLELREKEVALRTADRTCLQAFRQYLHVLGFTTGDHIASSAQVPALTDAPVTDDTIGHQASSHPELLKLESDIQAERQQKKVAQAANYPSVDFFADYDLVGRDPSSYSDSWTSLRSQDYMFGIKLTVNLYNGGRTQEQIRQAEAEVRVKQLQLKQKERQLAEEATAREAELATAKDNLAVAEARAKLKRSLFKIARRKFQSGRISKLAFRQQASATKNALDELTIARIDVVLAQTSFDLLVVEGG